MFPRLSFALLLIPLTALPASAAQPRATKCKVQKRQQGVFNVSPTSTSPATDLPTLASSTVILPSSTPSPTPTILPPFDYSKEKVRGVNLGGWFMMEPWITPSMFEETGNDAIVDEFTYGQYQDSDVAREKMLKHWSNFYSEDDFRLMREYGLNHARIPISWWSVPMEQNTVPYITGAWPYFRKALDWAAAHNIYVILDLHGAPGSQNGFDNSGLRTGNPEWGLQQSNINATVNIISYIAKEVGDKVSVIQLLNEIAGFRQGFGDAARQFWQSGYRAVRDTVGLGPKVMIGDAFLNVGSWSGYMTEPESSGVIMDLHAYQIFSEDELSRTDDQHISFACGRIPEFVDYASKNNWLVIGEWSLAKTDCTKWLNGRGNGARWDGTFGQGRNFGSCSPMTGNSDGFSDDYKTFLRKYWEAQVTAAEAVQGWVYWTWKAENSDDWSYSRGVEAGFIPKNPGDRKYPNICG